MQPCCWLIKSTVRVEIFELCCSQARQGVAYTLHLSLLTAAVAQRVSQRIESMRHTLSCMNRTPGYHCCERALDRFADGWDGLFVSPKTRSQNASPGAKALIGLVHHACPRVAPHVGARQEQPRFCSARRSSAGGRPRRLVSRAKVQPQRLDASRRRRRRRLRASLAARRASRLFFAQGGELRAALQGPPRHPPRAAGRLHAHLIHEEHPGLPRRNRGARGEKHRRSHHLGRE